MNMSNGKRKLKTMTLTNYLKKKKEASEDVDKIILQILLHKLKTTKKKARFVR